MGEIIVIGDVFKMEVKYSPILFLMVSPPLQ
jgi:hypothetical protein